MRARRLFSGTLIGLMVFALAGCDGGVTARQGPSPNKRNERAVFRYSLRLDSPADLDRAFAAGVAVDTIGMGIGRLLTPKSYELPLEGDRKFVELLKKTCGTSVARLLLSRSSSSNGSEEGSGELLLLVVDSGGVIDGKELVGRFVYSPKELRTCAIGWHEQVIVSNARIIYRRDGVDHSVIIFNGVTSTTRITSDSTWTTGETIATSDVVEVGRDVRSYWSGDPLSFAP